MKVAVLKGGRSLERGVSLRSGARVEDALARARPRRRRDRRRRGPRQPRSARSGPTSPSSPCTGPAARTAPSRSCSRSSASPTPARASPPACAAWTRSWPSTCCARPGIPTPDWVAFNATAFRELGAADALDEIEARLGFPLVVKPASQGSALGVRFAGAAATRSRRRCSPPSATTTGCCSSATSSGRELAVSMIDGEPLPIVEAIPREADQFNYEARYEIGRTDYACPAELERRRGGGGRATSPVATWEALGCDGFARVDLMLGADGPAGARGQRDPRPDRHVAAADGRRGGRALELRGVRWRGALEARRWRRHASGALAAVRSRQAASTAARRIVASLLARPRRSPRGDVVEEVLELLDDLLLVLDLVLELDRRLLDHLLGGEDRRVACGPRGRARRRGGSRSRPRCRRSRS